MTTYGVPYQGSKQRIAPDIVRMLPSGEVFVDVFAGGCAMTHAALAAGRWGRYVANDIGMGPQLFADAVAGRYKHESRWITREEFDRLKDTDPWVRYCWSFGNKGYSYMYAVELEPWKQALHYAVFFRDMGPFRSMGISDIPTPHGSTVGARYLWLKHRINARHLRIYLEWFAREMLELSGEDLERAIKAQQADVDAKAEELREYLRGALKASGLKASDVDRHLGTNGMAGHYFCASQWEFPTPEAYAKMQEIMPALDRPWGACGAYLQRLQSLQRLESLQRLQSLQSLESLQRLQRLQSLESLQRLQSLETARLDYRALEIPAGAVIYCDPPYKGTAEYAGAEGFDHEAFYDWCEAQTAPVYISEYYMPRDRFVCIWEREVKQLAGANTKGNKVTERLFIPKHRKP